MLAATCGGFVGVVSAEPGRHGLAGLGEELACSRAVGVERLLDLLDLQRLRRAGFDLLARLVLAEQLLVVLTGGRELRVGVVVVRCAASIVSLAIS